MTKKALKENIFFYKVRLIMYKYSLNLLPECIAHLYLRNDNGTSLLYKSLSILFSSMIYHGFAPQAFICANIIPIPKGSKASLTSSDKYRSIAISSVIGKILDHVIIDRLSDCLKTSDYQFGFKSNFNLLYYMYSNQLCHVKWGDETSANFLYIKWR